MWLTLRLLKWVGVGLYVLGVGGAVLARDPEERRRAAHGPATVGFVLTWLGGYGLARLTGTSLGSTWLSLGMLGSLATLQLVVWSTEREVPRGSWVRWLAAGLVVATLAVMVWRPGTRLVAEAPAAEEAR
ncbi:MAG: hypothetical protein H6732_12395 [Alphaproteobacteria bacterium]|nr:hypothetical protein [Alphaproteobacteria bacterium]